MSNNHPMPGDKDYKGGTFRSTIYINGKSYECKTIKDARGNVIRESISPLFLGIF